MIAQLEFSVRFPPTDHYPIGRSFDRSFDFDTGMTGIVGPNEVGKTLVIEMIEFLLFGSAALRGKAEDYKHLRCSGTVTIRGMQYQIERTHRNAAVKDATGIGLAVGTKPVNARIAQLLGYGLDVFRIANVANQGDAERLSKMLPSQRKAMVDKLIGADQIEAVGTWCGEQATGVTREIAGLEAGLMEPVSPRRPEGYRPAAELQAEIAGLREVRDSIVQHEAFLANPPAIPEAMPCPTQLSLASLERADAILGLRTYDFDLPEAIRKHDAVQLWLDRDAFMERHPRSTLKLHAAEEQIEAESLKRELARLRKSPTLTCPCGKPFTTADAEIARVEGELAAIPVLKGVYDFAAELRMAKDWADPKTVTTWDKVKDAVKPEVDLGPHPNEAKSAVHVSEIAGQLEALGCSGMARQAVQRLAASLRAWTAQEAAREAAQARRDAWEAKADEARQALSLARQVPPEQLAEAETLLDEVRLYDAMQARYETLAMEFETRSARLVQLRAEQISWRNGRAAMNELRADTKNYVVPALSKVASYLFSQMTGGSRTRISVDEEFEIEVDGQPLATLSGSGRVCANLAIRIGLGRILTKGVFAVFMGDEMDASMDEERAGFLHEALCVLERQGSQVLVITHKRPACSRVIGLES